MPFAVGGAGQALLALLREKCGELELVEIDAADVGVAEADGPGAEIGGDEDRFAYREQVKDIVSALNGTQEEQVRAYTFETISDFAKQMRTMIDSSSPLELVVGS